MSGHSKTWNWLDGRWVEGNPPMMGPRTHAAWLGSSVFDGARAFEGVMPDIDAHAARVNASAVSMGLNATMAADEIVAPLADYGGGSGTGACWIEDPAWPAAWSDLKTRR